MDRNSASDRSVAKEVENFQEYLNNGMTKLMGIWEDIGLRGEAVELRRLTVVTHLRNLVDEMVKEEETTRVNLFKNVTIFLSDLSKLCLELRKPPYQPDQNFSLLQKEQDLKIKVEQLTQEKHDRLEHFRDLSKMDQKLCTELCCIPYYIPSGTVPTDEQLMGMELHINKLDMEKNARVCLFKDTRESILSLMDELDIQPINQFEQDVVNSAEDYFLFSTENMKALNTFHDRLLKREKENGEAAEKLIEEIHAIWRQLNVSIEEREQFLAANQGIKQKTIQAMREELNRCKMLKIQNAKIVVGGLREQLTKIWDKCYISDNQRSVFLPYFSEEYNEELLVKHEEEIRKMRAHYEEHKSLLERVKQREDCWNKYLCYEERSKDPQRFFDKKRNLLMEEKERNQLAKDLPRVDNSVQEDIDKWQSLTGRIFLVNGMSFQDYVSSLWKEQTTQKDNEKLQRQQSRQKRTEEEMLYGSKPAVVTPVKRALTTPTGLQKSSTKSMRILPMSQRNAIPPHEVRLPILEPRSDPSSETFLLSQTVVGSSEIHRLEPETTIAPLEMYSEFEIMLNEDARSNTRSSVATRSIDSDD